MLRFFVVARLIFLLSVSSRIASHVPAWLLVALSALILRLQCRKLAFCMDHPDTPL